MCCALGLDLATYELEDLVGEFEGISHGHPRDGAEVAFAIGLLYLQRGNREKAKEWGLRSIQFFRQCDTSSMGKCEPVHPIIGGIRLPELIHDKAVMFRMKTYWGIPVSDDDLDS